MICTPYQFKVGPMTPRPRGGTARSNSFDAVSMSGRIEYWAGSRNRPGVSGTITLGKLPAEPQYWRKLRES
ncbi:MAG: hypothetical protein JXQ75_15305 [Phycisphaerae bacterium]|nr:hypothetical protein [Phycisphaerae bacterium]